MKNQTALEILACAERLGAWCWDSAPARWFSA